MTTKTEENAATEKQKMDEYLGNMNPFNRFLRKYYVLERTIYFLVTIAIYSTQTFSGIYFMVKWNLDTVGYGLVLCSMISGFFGSFIITKVADQTRLHMIILVSCSILYGIFYFLVNLNPYTFDRSGLNFQDNVKHMVWAISFFGIEIFFSSALFPLCDSMCLKRCMENPSFKKEAFGRIRLFSPVGHLVNALLVGLLKDINGNVLQEHFRDKNQQFSILYQKMDFALKMVKNITIPSDSVKCVIRSYIFKLSTAPEKYFKSDYIRIIKNEQSFTYAIIFFLVATILNAVVCFFAFPIRTPLKNKPVVQKQEKTTTTDVVKVVKQQSPFVLLMYNGKYWLFILNMIFFSSSKAILSHFLMNYVNEGTSSGFIQGVVTNLSKTVLEVIIYLLGKGIFDNLGAEWIMLLGQLAGFIRIGAYAFFPINTYGLMVPFLVEFLKGLYNALIMQACIRFIAANSDAECTATAQGIFSGIYSGFTMAGYGLAGGIYLDIKQFPTATYEKLFYYTTILCGIGLIHYIFEYAFIRRELTFNFVKKAKK